MIGSPPRLRGKPDLVKIGVAHDGLTPAPAGKTVRHDELTCIARAHPRACGENELSWLNPAHSAGSPPRLRGKPRTAALEQGRGGLTPAPAGKTAVGARQKDLARAHPRACGENSGTPRGSRKIAGSPPRLRGKLYSPPFSIVCHGLTPAPAGKTFRSVAQ